MLSIEDPTMLDDAVAEEWTSLSPCRLLGDNKIYTSAPFGLPDIAGDPIISDFGDAHFGDQPFYQKVMPNLFRAPEIVLGIPWDEKIDIWSFGLMVWHLFEGKSLFTERSPGREESRPAHLAKMISLLGPPPQDLLDKGGDTALFFDEDSAFKYKDMLPNTSLEMEEEILEGEEKVKFLAFIRKMLQWRPEDRAPASDLLNDPWISWVNGPKKG